MKENIFAPLKRVAVFGFVAALIACSPQSDAVTPLDKSVNKVSEKATSDLSAIQQTIQSKLSQGRPDIQVESITNSPIEGLYEVSLSGGGMVFFNTSGDYFIAGDMFAVQETGLVNLGDLRRNADRAKLIAAVESKDMIVFAPKGETKATINVFTDVDCGYCQKLHQEVPELNKMGVAVRYLAFPRAGVGSDAYNKIASAWCAKDPQDALTKLKKRQPIPNNVCDNNPVAAQFELGAQMGVRGTPALITEDGQLIPGYRPAKDLAKQLGAI